MGDEIRALAAKQLADELAKAGVPAALLEQRSWSGAGIGKLLIQTLVTPLTLSVFGVFMSGKMDQTQQGFITHLQNQAEQGQRQRQGEIQSERQLQQKHVLVSKRIWLWDQIAQDLYDIVCYLQEQPSCKDITPEDVISRQKHCEFMLSAYREFVPDSVEQSYLAFSAAAFEIPKDPQGTVKLKASFRGRPRGKKKPKPIFFAYGKDVEAARAQLKVILPAWEALRKTVSQMVQQSEDPPQRNPDQASPQKEQKH